MLKGLTCAAALMAASPAAAAINITYAQPFEGMTFVDVTGEISTGDGDKLAVALNNIDGMGVKPVVVRLSSPGGDVWAAMAMGELIRSRGMGTAVPPGNSCTSACVFVFLGGAIRQANGDLGVHHSYYAANLQETADQLTLNGQWAYFQRMDAPRWLYDLQQSTPAAEMRMLDDGQKISLRYTPASRLIAAKACTMEEVAGRDNICAWEAYLVSLRPSVEPAAAEPAPANETVVQKTSSKKPRKAKVASYAGKQRHTDGQFRRHDTD